MTTTNEIWRTLSQNIVSLGSTTRRPGSLAGLHKFRKENLGQYFTPAALAMWVWKMVSPAMANALEADDQHACVSILDNACGSGSLLQYADPAHHVLVGIDVHEESIDALSRDAMAAGFQCEFSSRGMEQCRPDGFGIAILNPPFSLHLESPNLDPGFATTYGRFGPDSSCLSHAYALQQGLNAADTVAAILPRSYAQTIIDQPDAWPRLVAAFHVPSWCFREQGAQVRVSVLFFDRYARSCSDILVENLDEALSVTPDLGLSCRTNRGRSARLREIGMEIEAPTIVRPVTGNTRVRVGHNGAKITLRFSCGLTEAKVRNVILRERLVPTGIEGHRYPKGVRYTGEGALDLEVHLLQDDPARSLADFIDEIHAAGGTPDVDPGLMRYLARRTRRLAVERTPYRHTALLKSSMAGGGSAISGTARETHVTDPAVWGSPVVKAGSTIDFQRDTNGNYVYKALNRAYTLSEDEVNRRFDISSGLDKDRWVTVHEGRNMLFPHLAHTLTKRAEAAGLDAFMSWDYQLSDLIELSMTRRGIAAWAVGLGKARLAVALVLLSGCKTGLICTEAYLIGEMVKELQELPLSATDWQVIEGPEQLSTLRRINIISYSRLRSPIAGGNKRRTYASRLRRRIGTLVADEGDLLRNRSSQQTAALWQISAKRRYILTGTPIGNYPKDIFNLLSFSGGDATACQPYGMRNWHLVPELRLSTRGSIPGVDAVRGTFISVEWCSHAWKDDLTAGAKREVPRLRNLPLYRAAIGHHVKRRLAQEPDVARYFTIPVPRRTVTQIEWDDAHLAYYLTVCDEFRSWYMQGRGGSREHNLVALLARIQAVQLAASIPQRHTLSAPFFYRGGLTSKQRYACNRLEQLTNQGHKTIAYAEWPDLLDLVADELQQRGIASVVIHGRKPIRERMRLLDEEFRYGSAPVLLASFGVAQRGLNVPQADRVLFLTRSWAAKTEQQAEGRILRPQQKRPVESEFLELAGSIDAYQGQMVTHKQDSISAGLDWGAPEFANVEFLHLDSILFRFVQELAEQFGCTAREVRERLVA